MQRRKQREHERRLGNVRRETKFGSPQQREPSKAPRPTKPPMTVCPSRHENKRTRFEIDQGPVRILKRPFCNSMTSSKRPAAVSTAAATRKGSRQFAEGSRRCGWRQAPDPPGNWWVGDTKSQRLVLRSQSLRTASPVVSHAKPPSHQS